MKRIEKRHVGVDGWNLGETLILGPNNSKKVKAIVDDFFVDTEVLILTRNYVWLREDIQAFVKNKLTQRFKGLKVKESKSNLTDEELTAATLKNRYATRKNHVKPLVNAIENTLKLTFFNLDLGQTIGYIRKPKVKVVGSFSS